MKSEHRAFGLVSITGIKPSFVVGLDGVKGQSDACSGEIISVCYCLSSLDFLFFP